MKWYPILFKSEMVRAILDGKKTQTRRVIKPQPEIIKGNPNILSNTAQGILKTRCPYGYPGDNLWVRETWRPLEGYEDIKPSDIPEGEPIVYLRDCLQHPEKYPIYNQPYEKTYDCSPWKPSIFMPRWASRIDLSTKDIRVEKVQDISEEDAIAEGIDKSGTFWKDYRKGGMKQVMLQDPIDSFRTLWNLINEKRGFGWDVNPWVWVINFKLLEVRHGKNDDR